MQLKTFKGGYDNNFGYIIHNSSEAIIIDTAIEPKILINYIKKNNLQLKCAIIMHSHFDHLVGYDYYRENRIQLAGSDNLLKEINQRLKDGDEITLGKYKLKIMTTPGHLYDCLCILVDGKLFTSDTLFIDGCGRCDLSGANVDEMYKSLERIKELPDETIIYPGHDYGPVPFSSLSKQKKSNFYLQAKSKEEFVNGRMRLQDIR
jgi:glyoxylase-like metal-dependent hydrolase (beta-lactamase superfamily II)